MRKQLPRLRTHSLCMLKVAGVMIGDVQGNGMPFRSWIEFSEEFEDVPALCRERSCTFGILLIVAEQMAVVF